MKNELKISRIEALCDGIFAIAMTLLIVGFNDLLKWPGSMTEPQLRGAILDMLPDLAYYVQGFIILAAFWIEHHQQFHYIKHVNLTLLSINMAALMFVALIPFSTLLVGDWGYLKTADIVFELNLLGAGTLFYIHWAYAVSRPGMVDSECDKKVIEFYKRKNSIIPIISIIAIGISLINPMVGSAMYFLVPLIIFLEKGKIRS